MTAGSGAASLTLGLTITGLWLFWLLVSFVRSPGDAIPVLAGILTLPLFLRFSGSGIALGDESTAYYFSTGQTLPVGIFGVVLFAGLAAVYTAAGPMRWRRSPVVLPALAFIVVNVVVFLVGMLEEFHFENLGFLAQTVGPVLCLFLAVNFARDAQTIRRAVVACVYVMGIAIVAITASTLLIQAPLGAVLHTAPGLNRVHLGPFPVYQSHDYFPLAVAVAYGLGLALLLGRVPAGSPALLTGFVLAMFVSVFFLHSVGALLTMVAITVLELLTMSAVRLRRTAVAAFAAVAALAGVLILSPQSSTLSHVRALATGGGDLGVATRRIDAGRALDSILDDPLAGSRYLAGEVDFRGIRHIANPHNQYLTYSSRAGLIALLLYVWIVVIVLRHLGGVIRSALPVERSLAVGLSRTLLGVLVISNLLQDNFVQPYSGSLLWLVLGLGEALYLAGPPPSAASEAAVASRGSR